MCKALLTGCFGLLVILAGGCSEPVIPAQSVAEREKAYDEAVALVSQKNYSAALASLDKALSGSGLNSDLYAEALLSRAICYIELGQLDLAEKDLAAAEPGVPDQAKFLMIRAKLLKGRGDVAGATAAQQKAQQINPAIKML